MENRDKLFFGLVILCLIGICVLIFYMSQETTQCIKNPYVYGASKMGDVSCSCIQDVVGGKISYFSFNDTFLDLAPKSIYGNLEINP